MQRERRRDPYPWSWEIPVAIMVAVAGVVVFGIQLGRSAANLAAGAGWTWPAADTGVVSSPVGTAFWGSLFGVLGGDAGAGLSDSASDSLAGTGLLWTFLVATEVLFLVLAVWAATSIYLRWGPGRMHGMATAAEAEKLLGVTRLRKVAALVRPDLHGKPTQTVSSHHHRVAGLEAEPSSVQIGRGLSTPWLRRTDGGN
ncbi:hypothetical protein BSP109_02201 [Brevibacterium sp. Mu109]|uniref:hypothetical protein n=1 Tax=Brevibacterium sp. Mu109 TaxID=1255669 RepID=UPI000C3FBD29|nr:hypothetical protein [Brevibacterium sp. Mu109]SMX87316.1 hypothetical protein BSP109_02201 [Brevibacterium sp. Mu109]